MTSQHAIIFFMKRTMKVLFAMFTVHARAREYNCLFIGFSGPVSLLMQSDHWGNPRFVLSSCTCSESFFLANVKSYEGESKMKGIFQK